MHGRPQPRFMPGDLAFLEALTGMGSGYASGIGGRAAFADVLPLDIYDDAYATRGDSMGKRFRAVLDVAQPAAVAQALTALWEHHERTRIASEEPERIPDARVRLSAIVERFGGSPLPAHSAPGTSFVETAPVAHRAGPDTATLDALRREFYALHRMPERPQARGLAFEGFLNRLFDAWGMAPRGSFRLLGEQIDGSFEQAGHTYLVEAKWQSAPIGKRDLDAFEGKLAVRPAWTRGLFVSVSGFSKEAQEAFKPRRAILMNGMDLAHALERGLSLPRIVSRKERRGAEEERAFLSVSELFPLNE